MPALRGLRFSTTAWLCGTCAPMLTLAWIVVRGAPSYAGNESLHGHKLQDCDVGNAFQCMKALGRALRKHRHKKKTTG
eukprot:scaffold71805_cov15-Tisochrysis_lutea.AAC.2